MYEFAGILIFSLGLIILSKSFSRGSILIFFVYFTISVFVPYLTPREVDFFSEKFTRFLDVEVAGMAFFILCSSFTIVMISYYITKIKSNRRKLVVIYSQDNSIAMKFAVISILFSLIYILMSVMIFGSVSGALINSYKRVQSESSISNLRSVFYWASTIASLFAYFFLTKLKPSISGALTVLSIFIGILLSLSNGGRSVFILYLVALAYPVAIHATKRKFVTYITVFIAMVLVISPAMIYTRYLMQGAEAINDFSFSEYALTGVRYIDHFIISILYTDYYGHDFGRLYINAALSYIPSGLWEGKPQLVSANLRYFLYGDYTGGVPPGLFGESFISFGFLGPPLVSIILGFSLAKFDMMINVVKNRYSVVHYVAIGVFSPLLGFTLIRGGVDIGVFRVGLPAIWLFIFYWGLRFMVKPSRITIHR